MRIIIALSWRSKASQQLQTSIRLRYKALHTVQRFTVQHFDAAMSHVVHFKAIFGARPVNASLAVFPLACASTSSHVIARSALLRLSVFLLATRFARTVTSQK